MTNEMVYKLQQLRILQEDFVLLLVKAKKMHLRVLSRDRYGKEIDTLEIELDTYMLPQEREV